MEMLLLRSISLARSPNIIPKMQELPIDFNHVLIYTIGSITGNVTGKATVAVILY
jgi:hypothetical protein